MNTQSYSTIIEEPEAEGLRVDKYVADYLGLFTRSQLTQRAAEFLLDGRPIKPAKTVKTGSVLEIRYAPAVEMKIEAEAIDLDIIYEDSRVIVVNKPQGMVVHPAAGNFSGTLVQGLLHHIEKLKERFPEREMRPGIVHRLDKDTSGVIIAAKDPDALASLSNQFAERRVKKRYLAVLRGYPAKLTGRITRPIGRDPRNRKKFTWKNPAGKTAETEYRCIRRLKEGGLVLLSPKTGRTHQLRVHMASTGHPILGDPLYGKRNKGDPDYTLMLHAYSLRIELPNGGIRTFRAPLPERFRCLPAAGN